MTTTAVELETGLPCDIDTERFILGWIAVGGNEAFAACATALSAEDFALQKHRTIFSVMRDLDSAGRIIGRVEIASELMKRHQLESVDGLGYLVDLDTGMPLVAEISSYVQIVRQKSLLRQVAIAAQSLMNRALLADDDPASILAHADTILARLSQREGSQPDWQSPGQIIEAYPGGLSAFVTPSRGGTGIQLPWPQVNNTLCGLQPGDLFLLAARPSHGKSAAALQLTYETAKAGRGVAYYSLEMSPASLVRRLISQVSGVDGQRMRLGYLNADERARISLAVQEIESLPIWIDYRGYTTPAIRRALKKLRAEHDVLLVVVDHFHLLQTIGHEDDRQRYARAADDLQRYSKEFGVPFVVLTQLNRRCEEDNRAPGLSDLAETGKLEQNADIVMFCHRPEVYAKNRAREDLRGIAEFIVAKQRNGPTGKVDMVFLSKVQTFVEAAR